MTAIEKIRAEVAKVREQYQASVASDTDNMLTYELLTLAEDKLKLAEALEQIARYDPDAPEVESWKWLARRFKDIAEYSLTAVAR